MQRGGNEQGTTPPRFSEALFEEFHAETFRSVWLLAWRLCRDPTEADDVCQVAYLAVYRYWVDDRLREEPRRLLFRVAQRTAIDSVRRRERRSRLSELLRGASQPADELGLELKEALSKLKPEDRALLLLQAEGGFDYKELAAIYARSVASIRSRLYRARKALAREIRR